MSIIIILHIDLLDYRNTVLVVVAQTPDIPLPSDNGIETPPIQCDLSNVLGIGYYQVGGAGYRGHLCKN